MTEEQVCRYGRFVWVRFHGCLPEQCRPPVYLHQPRLADLAADSGAPDQAFRPPAVGMGELGLDVEESA